MEIRIIEVPTKRDANTTPIDTPEQIRSNIAEELKEDNRSKSSQGFNLSLKAAFDSKLQNSLQKAYYKKEVAQMQQKYNTNELSQSQNAEANASASSKAAGGIALATFAISTAANIGVGIADIALTGSKYGEMGGNQVAARKLQNIKRATNKVHSPITGTLQSAVVGAAAGAAFGPWGMAIGAAIGTIGGIAESAMSTAKEAKIIAIQTAEANSETAKSLQHMGYNGGR